MKRTRAPSEPNSQGKGKRAKRKAVEPERPPEQAQDRSSAKAWPEHFQTLFKTFKALNTVLAFRSSKNQLATTFDTMRSSVESLLKRPLEMAQVAELKALLPHIVDFAYVPRGEMNSLGVEAHSKRRDDPFAAGPCHGRLDDHARDHILILGLQAETRKTTPSTSSGTLNAIATQKLVKRRNDCFCTAIDALITRCDGPEEAVALLRSAGEEHVPVDPSEQAKQDSGPLVVPDSASRPSIEEIVKEVMTQDWYQAQARVRRVFDPREPSLATLDPEPSQSIQEALLAARNINTFYSHQALAINAVYNGKSVIVSTSTASGKSVVYQVPILRFLEQDPNATAIFIYPTKALAQDQKAALENLLRCCSGLEHVNVATYDGDTPTELRKNIRETSSVIFTNFDMLHASILPHEELWRTFLKNMKLFVADELHYYNGVFGTHVAHIIRRFRRICDALGNRRICFVSCSATIGQPLLHMRQLFGIEDVVEVTHDGAPAGKKDFILWDPIPRDNIDHHQFSSKPMTDATRLMRFLMSRGVRTILFCKIRKVCELVMKTLRTELSRDGRLDILDRVVGYRGGYSSTDRRRIEAEAFSGRLLGIVATNALELGVDIGTLDAVIMLGFPVTIASFRQQAGRAGRRARDSLAILVAQSLPVDHHFIKNPNELFDNFQDTIPLDLENRIVLEAHLQCAAEEMPLRKEDTRYFGTTAVDLLETKLIADEDGWYHAHPKHLPYPAKHISIRGAREDTYCIVDVTTPNRERILEHIEVTRALFEVYEGGIFLHQGTTFLMQEISHDSKIVRAMQTDVDWTTEPRDFTNIDAKETQRIKEIRGSPHFAYYGRVDLFTKVYGYYKIRNGRIIDSVEVDNLPWHRETTGLWMDVPEATLALLRSCSIMPAEAIHSAQHAFLNKFALKSDLRTECKVPEKEFKVHGSSRDRPGRLIFYDAVENGPAIAAHVFDHTHDILCQAHAAITSCDCAEGCVQCILDPRCKEGNAIYSKLGASIVLKGILDIFLDPNDLTVNEDTEEAHHRHPITDSIVAAPRVPVAEGVKVEILQKSFSS